MRAALPLALAALVLTGCPRDRVPVETAAPPREPQPALPKQAAPPAPVPATPVAALPTDAPAVTLSLLVRNKRRRHLRLADARIPSRLTAAQLAQAPGGLELVVGETRVQVAVGASLEDYVRFLLGTLGALDESLQPELKRYLPAAGFMGLKRVVGAAFQKDQSLLVLQTAASGDELRFSYLNPIGQAQHAPYVKELPVPRARWIAAATATLDGYFAACEKLGAPSRPASADQRARHLLGLWHQVAWKLKLS